MHGTPPHEPPTGSAPPSAAPINRHPAIGAPFSIFLDHMRWIAALLVVVGHVRQFFFVDYAEVTHRSPLWSAFYTVSRFQHQAVLLFFLLSGAMIAGRFTRRDSWRRFDLADYSAARLTRLWLVLVPVLMLCVVQIAVTPAHYLPQDCAIGAGRLFGNLLFVQEILVAPLCNNVPLWSLANEFWYYAFAGGAVYAVATPYAARRLATVALLVAVATVIAANDAWTEKAVLPYLPIWLLGAVALHPRMPAPPLVPALLLFAAALVGARLVPLPFYLRDWAFAFATFVLLIAARGAPAAGWFARTMERSAWIARPLAGRSYSLYLVHYPVCVAMLSVVVAWRGVARTQPGVLGLSMMATILALSYGLAQLLYWLFESRTADVRAAVVDKMKGRAR